MGAAPSSRSSWRRRPHRGRLCGRSCGDWGRRGAAGRDHVAARAWQQSVYGPQSARGAAGAPHTTLPPLYSPRGAAAAGQGTQGVGNAPTLHPGAAGPALRPRSCLTGLISQQQSRRAANLSCSQLQLGLRATTNPPCTCPAACRLRRQRQGRRAAARPRGGTAAGPGGAIRRPRQRATAQPPVPRGAQDGRGAPHSREL
jgi:hypothetical protein